jgi:hypothetical protein|tara:strand:+ start:216 stop:320 length:105 start_codon:yes stop_codon:yes gene_type:complete
MAHKEVSDKFDELASGLLDGSFEVAPNYSSPVSD